MKCIHCGESIETDRYIGTQDGNYHVECRMEEIDNMCEMLKRIWYVRKHLRLGQLLENFVFKMKDPYYFGDLETMKKMEDVK